MFWMTLSSWFWGRHRAPRKHFSWTSLWSLKMDKP